jgi:hypothetical protein
MVIIRMKLNVALEIIWFMLNILLIFSVPAFLMFTILNIVKYR